MHVSLTRFSDVVINENETVDIGAGLSWTDVYAAIVPKGINVVGGRQNGYGVSGLTLGGGEKFSGPYPVHDDDSKPYLPDRILLED